MEIESLKDFLIGKQKAFVKAVFEVRRIAKNDVTQVVRQHGREACLVRKHVQQPSADHNGVAQDERLQGRRQQDAAAQVGKLVQKIVCDQQVLHHGFEHGIDASVVRHQSGNLQALNDVIFRRVLHALLAEERTQVLPGSVITHERYFN